MQFDCIRIALAWVCVSFVFQSQSQAQTYSETKTGAQMGSQLVTDQASTPTSNIKSPSKPAGRVLFVAGLVELEKPENNRLIKIALKAKDPISSGETVVTGVDGRTQLQFNDGSLFSLQPNTRFRVDEYIFNSNQHRSYFSLLKGAIRTSSGAIGKRDPGDYRLQTPSGTVGIRGTEYLAEETVCEPICPAGKPAGLRVQVSEGRVVVNNSAGSVEISAGQGAFIPFNGGAPQSLDRPIIWTSAAPSNQSLTAQILDQFNNYSAFTNPTTIQSAESVLSSARATLAAMPQVSANLLIGTHVSLGNLRASSSPTKLPMISAVEPTDLSGTDSVNESALEVAESSENWGAEDLSTTITPVFHARSSMTPVVAASQWQPGSIEVAINHQTSQSSVTGTTSNSPEFRSESNNSNSSGSGSSNNNSNSSGSGSSNNNSNSSGSGSSNNNSNSSGSGSNNIAIAPGSIPASAVYVELRNVPFLTSASLTTGLATVQFDQQGHLQSLGLCPSLLCLSRGTAQAVDAGYDAYVAWGRWTNGEARTSIAGLVSSHLLTDPSSMHYLIGSPSMSMPTSGSADYSLIGATIATGAATEPYEFSGSLRVVFAPNLGTRVGMNATLSSNGQAQYQLTTTGGLSNPEQSELRMISLNRFRGTVATQSLTNDRDCQANGCSTEVQGTFFGNQQQRVGIGYVLRGRNGAKMQGVAVFKRD